MQSDEPSGRSLDPGREAGTRGMIVMEQAHEGRPVQNPAYKLPAIFFMCLRSVFRKPNGET
jgi:hypothetical protein